MISDVKKYEKFFSHIMENYTDSISALVLNEDVRTPFIISKLTEIIESSPILMKYNYHFNKATFLVECLDLDVEFEEKIPVKNNIKIVTPFSDPDTFRGVRFKAVLFDGKPNQHLFDLINFRLEKEIVFTTWRT